MKEFHLEPGTLAWCNANLAAPVGQVTPLRVEASHRHFYRLSCAGQNVVLMVSPPELERNEEFVALAGVFLRRGVPVPEIHAANLERGYVLMADLGAADFEAAYQGKQRETALAAAIDALGRIRDVSDDRIAPYTVERLTDELSLFDEWFVRGLSLGPTDGVLGTAGHLLIDATQAQPQCCVHRDYHCRNLLWNDDRLGIVDFQDALHGPMLYDVASLLRDCYYVFSESEIDRWLTVFLAGADALHGEAWETVRRWFDFTAIQRQLKAIGIFARLHLRDHKSAHLRYILPLLERVLALVGLYPELAPLRSHLQLCLTPAAQALKRTGAA